MMIYRKRYTYIVFGVHIGIHYRIYSNRVGERMRDGASRGLFIEGFYAHNACLNTHIRSGGLLVDDDVRSSTALQYIR